MLIEKCHGRIKYIMKLGIEQNIKHKASMTSSENIFSQDCTKRQLEIFIHRIARSTYDIYIEQ